MFYVDYISLAIREMLMMFWQPSIYYKILYDRFDKENSLQTDQLIHTAQYFTSVLHYKLIRSWYDRDFARCNKLKYNIICWELLSEMDVWLEEIHNKIGVGLNNVPVFILTSSCKKIIELGLSWIRFEMRRFTQQSLFLSGYTLISLYLVEGEFLMPDVIFKCIDPVEDVLDLKSERLVL